ncbi:MAG: Alpha/beta hydrolase [Magnetococcales bacterium]|nr:Alpha/beta hydrolase [Magnetococcales bacterium]
MTRQFLSIHGLTMAVYESSGREGPTLFFLHGNSQDASAFSLQMEGEPGRRFRCVCMDLPGHGASGRALDPERVYSVQGYVAVVREVLHLLDIQTPLLVGHSLGGHLLIQVAAGWPDLLGLLVFGTPPLQNPPRFDHAFLPHPTTKLFMQEHLTESDVKLWSEAQGLPEAATHRIAQAMRQTDPKCRSSMATAIARGELQDECAILRNSGFPVALLLGDRDPFVNQDYCNNLSLHNLWRGGVHFISGCGHSPQSEHSAEFNATLMAFIDDCVLNSKRTPQCRGTLGT